MSLDRRIWQITYPIFLGLLAQNIINVTDTAFLGRVGEVALGAAGTCGAIIFRLYYALFGTFALYLHYPTYQHHYQH